jgi:hypothetical protein
MMMAIRKNYRQFSMAELRMGAPVGFADDQKEVTIFLKGEDYVIGACRVKDGEWQPFKTIEGNPLTAGLLILPIGLCKDAPVYVGDVLMDENGHRFTVESTHTESMLAACSWPTAVPNIYPEPRENEKLVAVLNAALDLLRSVTTKEQYPAVANKLVNEYVSIIGTEGK